MSFRSKRYLQYVRAHECLGCGHPAPSEAHHCAPPGVSRHTTGGGMAAKMCDMWTVPCCKKCHSRWHSSLNYRQFSGMTRDASDQRIAVTQLELMAHWIRLLDSDTDLF